MWLGIVIGNVWCTKKVSALTGQTFLLVTRGSGARVAAGESIPVDAAVVGIVDRVEQ